MTQWRSSSVPRSSFLTARQDRDAQPPLTRRQDAVICSSEFVPHSSSRLVEVQPLTRLHFLLV